MQQVHSINQKRGEWLAARPAESRSLFDRYRPAALLLLLDAKPFHVLLETDGFGSLLLRALPDFEGDATDAVAMLSDAHLLAACRAMKPVDPSSLANALPVLVQIADTLGLSHTDQLILAFLAEAQGDGFWEEWSGHFGVRTRGAALRSLARVLGLEEHAVRATFETGGALAESALFERRFLARRAAFFDHFPLHVDVDAALLRSSDDWSAFTRRRFDVCPARGKALDFSHLEPRLQPIVEVLKTALRDGMPGVHVLLHGPAGTGKTTLARDIARRLRVPLLEVRAEFGTGPDTDGEARARNYELGQRFGWSGDPCLMLFDELEDLLPPPWPFGRAVRAHKGWLCQVLEQARTPTLWTSNSTDGIDPAILRRFSHLLEVGVPPQGQRLRLLREAVKGTGVREDWLQQVAAIETLTPALTSHLGETARALQARGPALESALTGWLAERLRAAGQTLPRLDQTPQPFRCDWLRLDTDPEELIAGLGRAGEGRLCLHGPPGTGKTAFAHHLAERLDRPALVRKGSDLRSKWVGETEQNIAAMFARAAREGAVLILDEADGFLYNREGRRVSWELNEVTEFLVQLENFAGYFCATTNRFQELDPAFLRRFDLKLRFDYLDQAQCEAVMKATLRTLGCPARIGPRTRERLANLDTLTPGDFAVAARRLRFSGSPPNQAELLSALVHEVECKKKHGGRPIGFRWGE